MTLDRGACCLLVTGAPGAGKSTVTRALTQALTRSALLDGYVVSTMVVGGYLWPLGEPRDEALRQSDLCVRNLGVLAAGFVDAGFTPVIDSVLPSARELGLLVEHLGPRTLRMVVLQPGADACRARNLARDEREQFFFDDYDGLEASMRAGFGDRGWWFDTAGLTADETVRQILLEADERGRVSPPPAGP